MSPSRKVLGLTNSELVRSVAASLSTAPMTYSMRRHDLQFVVFCFATAEDAEAFAERFGGDPENKRAERVVQNERKRQEDRTNRRATMQPPISSESDPFRKWRL